MQCRKKELIKQSPACQCEGDEQPRPSIFNLSQSGVSSLKRSYIAACAPRVLMQYTLIWSDSVKGALMRPGTDNSATCNVFDTDPNGDVCCERTEEESRGRKMQVEHYRLHLVPVSFPCLLFSSLSLFLKATSVVLHSVMACTEPPTRAKKGRKGQTAAAAAAAAQAEAEREKELRRESALAQQGKQGDW
eukprot:scaffold44390_cov20-Tisochrysis_lutea.AAC.5